MSTLVMENDAQDYYGGQIGPGLTCGDWGPDISIQTLSVNIIICISNETLRGKVEIDFFYFPFSCNSSSGPLESCSGQNEMK